MPKPRLVFGDKSALWQAQRKSNGTQRKVRKQANAPVQPSLFDAVPVGADAPAERVEATQLALFA